MSIVFFFVATIIFIVFAVRKISHYYRISPLPCSYCLFRFEQRQKTLKNMILHNCLTAFKTKERSNLQNWKKEIVFNRFSWKEMKKFDVKLRMSLFCVCNSNNRFISTCLRFLFTIVIRLYYARALCIVRFYVLELRWNNKL